MKIIGKTDKGYLMDLSHGEVSHLLGKSWLSEDETKQHCRVGCEIDLKPWADAMIWLKKNKHGLHGVASQLEDFAKKLKETPEPFDFASEPIQRMR